MARDRVDRRDLIYFIGFYICYAAFQYILSWAYWGGLERNDHPPFLDISEFFASAGCELIVRFILTIPVWYFIFRLLKDVDLRYRILLYLLIIPLLTFLEYFAMTNIQAIYGWASVYNDYRRAMDFFKSANFFILQFALIHAYTLLKQFKEEETEKLHFQEAALNSEISALKSQLNPHFLHNMFNSINASIPPEQEITRELIIKMSELFRHQNAISDKDHISIKEELDFIHNYLDLTKVRMKDRFNFTINVEEEILSRTIPPMILQPLIENAIQHGIDKKLEGGHLYLSISDAHGKTKFIIKDNGVGINDLNGIFNNGKGLSNTKLRLSKMYQSSLVITSKHKEGTKIEFSL